MSNGIKIKPAITLPELDRPKKQKDILEALDKIL
jgi:hypothetical protein